MEPSSVKNAEMKKFARGTFDRKKVNEPVAKRKKTEDKGLFHKQASLNNLKNDQSKLNVVIIPRTGSW